MPRGTQCNWVWKLWPLWNASLCSYSGLVGRRLPRIKPSTEGFSLKLIFLTVRPDIVARQSYLLVRTLVVALSVSMQDLTRRLDSRVIVCDCMEKPARNGPRNSEGVR